MIDIFLNTIAIAFGVSAPWLIWLLLKMLLLSFSTLSSGIESAVYHHKERLQKLEIKDVLSHQPNSWVLDRTSQPPNPQMITLHFRKCISDYEFEVSVWKKDLRHGL